MDIDSWLRSLGLEQYEAAFRENAITEKVLPRLTSEDLKDLGVTIVGHRRVLLDAIADLRPAKDAEAPSAAFEMRLRGLTGARDEFILAAIAQNLKTLALRIWRPPPSMPNVCVA